MLCTLHFFLSLSSKCSLFHNANCFGSCIIHILYRECAEIKKNNNSGAKGLTPSQYVAICPPILSHCSGKGTCTRKPNDDRLFTVFPTTIHLLVVPFTYSYTSPFVRHACLLCYKFHVTFAFSLLTVTPSS
jgi:hypothetical protein